MADKSEQIKRIFIVYTYIWLRRCLLENNRNFKNTKNTLRYLLGRFPKSCKNNTSSQILKAHLTEQSMTVESEEECKSINLNITKVRVCVKDWRYNL